MRSLLHAVGSKQAGVLAVWCGALALAVAGGLNCAAAASTPVASSPSSVPTVVLEYQETSASLTSCGVSVSSRSKPFTKEPRFDSDKVVRGSLQFGGGGSNAISFAWERPARKLWLDLNRNLDLTDDAAGVFTARQGAPDNFPNFPGVHLAFTNAAGSEPFLVDLTLYDYGQVLNAYAAVRSFWQGRVSLRGEDWQVGVVADPAQKPFSAEGRSLLLRRWAERDRPFQLNSGSLEAFASARHLFFQGQAYEVVLTRQAQGPLLGFSAAFKEQQPKLGELEIKGEFLQRVVLEGGPYTVVLDTPKPVTRIPAGTYSRQSASLKKAGTEAYLNAYGPASSSALTVDEKRRAVLAVGGPLTNMVSVRRHGRSLALNYELVGADGRAYQLQNRDYSKAPQFTIHRGATQIASGKFEFG